MKIGLELAHLSKVGGWLRRLFGSMLRYGLEVNACNLDARPLLLSNDDGVNVGSRRWNDRLLLDRLLGGNQRVVHRNSDRARVVDRCDRTLITLGLNVFNRRIAISG